MKKKLIKYQSGGTSNDMFKQFMAMMGGGSAANSGLFNFNFNTKKSIENGGQMQEVANEPLNKFLNNGVSGLANAAVGAGMQYYSNKQPGSTSQDNRIGLADAISSTALSTMAQVPGVVRLIGGALSAVNTIGGGLLNRKFNKDLGTGSKVLNETSAFGGLTANQNQIQSDKNVGSTLIGGLFAGKKKKSLLAGQKQLNQKGTMVSNMLSFNKRKQGDALSSGDVLGQLNKLTQNGMDFDDIQFGKKGMMMEFKFLKERIKPYKPMTHLPLNLLRDSRSQKGDILRKMNQIYDTQRDLRKQIKEVEKILKVKVEMKKAGGPINVIVDGLLHAHKHDLKTLLTFKDADITHKGVPVIMQEGGEIVQTAEVEGNELILHLDLTKKMEELMLDGSEDAMIEAGKILSKEIVKNTKDSKSKLLKND